MSSSRSISILFFVMLVMLLGGCTTQQRLTRLDDDAAALLDEAQKIQFGADASPEVIDIAHYHAWEPQAGAKPEDVLKINLREALELAARHSRSYQDARETLYNSALSLRAQQHSWEWNPTNNFSALLGVDQKPSSTTFTTNSSVGFNKMLLSGGRLTGSIALATIRYCTGDRSVSMQTLANLTLNQPLLAGSGRLVARESLTQAERNLIYALRSYIRTREQLLINIASLYYEVLNAEANLRIGEQNYASLKYSRELSEAKRDSGRVTQSDVDQARQRLLSAESSIVSYQESIQNAKDDLKVALAIPLDQEIEVDKEDMDVLERIVLPTPSMPLDAAIKQALERRLDFATTRDRLEDAERAVKIAEDAMRAQLDFSASASARSVNRNRAGFPRLHGTDFTFGLDADLPLDRVTQTIALKRAHISLDQQKREVDEARDELIRSLRHTWNNLRSYAKKVEIQKIAISLAERRVENNRLLFEDGRIAIREYLDSQDDLSNARNSLAQQLVAHRKCWLQLLYQLDELKVDPQTLWTEQLNVN
jgi:outer membrane protein TolC